MNPLPSPAPGAPGSLPGPLPSPIPGAPGAPLHIPEEARDELTRLLEESPFLLWAPNPGPQTEAYFSQADEMLYGGSAGGGKSSLILGLALTQHQRSLVIRRESTQLRGMKDDLARIIKTRDGLNNQAGQWRLPASVSRVTGIADQLIEFGGVPNPGDEEAHQGIPHDLLAFDEVTQLPEYVIDYLSTWNRSTVPSQRCRIVLCSNPPTPSTQYNQRSGQGQWIIRRYAPWLDPQYRDPLQLGPAAPGELRWFVTLDGVEREWPDGLPFVHYPASATTTEEIITPRSRTFIPARVSDNPYLANSSYEATLQKLPEPLRSALLYGDFSISLVDAPMQLFPADWVRAATQRHRDTVASSPTGDPTHNRELSAIGVDVARGGMDSTVIVKRYGPWVNQPILVPGSKASTGPEVAAVVLSHRRASCPLVIDANGVGASVYDHLTQSLGISGVHAYVGSKKSLRRDQSNKFGFLNLRSERYWMLRQALDPSSPTKLALPDDPELVEELLSMTWEEQSSKIKVISKKDLIKILGRSPDKADALMLSFASPHADEEDEEPLEQPRSRVDRIYLRAPTREEDLSSRTQYQSSIDRPKPYQVHSRRSRRTRW